MTSSSLTRDNCFHGEFSQLIWDTPKISSDCSTINFSDMSNICFIVRSSVFLMECNFSELFFPMNTDVSNVEAINITQVIERLSMSCSESSGERFNIFRTWSFTPLKNERDFRQRSDSVQCQSPYHHRWQTCHLRVSPFLLPRFHQISSFEKTTCRQCSILSSLMS